MATSVLCRACHTRHDPLLSCPTSIRELAKARSVGETRKAHDRVVVRASEKIEPAAPVSPEVRAVVKAVVEKMAKDYVDPWAGCPHCAARRAKKAAAQKRRRGKS